MSGIKVETAWSTKAVTTAEVKTHLRIDSGFTDDDTYIDTLIESAQNVIETYLKRSITTQTLSLYSVVKGQRKQNSNLFHQV